MFSPAHCPLGGQASAWCRTARTGRPADRTSRCINRTATGWRNSRSPHPLPHVEQPLSHSDS